MPPQMLSRAQTGGRAAEVSRVSSIGTQAHGTPIRYVGPSSTTTVGSYPDSVTQSHSSDGITMQSPPLGPYPPNSYHSTDLRTQPNYLQLNIPNMPENLTGFYPESSSCQIGFSNSHHLVTGSPPPLGMVNAGSVEQSPGPYGSPGQTQVYQTSIWARMVDYNASQQTAILFDGLATVPVSNGVST